MTYYRIITKTGTINLETQDSLTRTLLDRITKLNVIGSYGNIVKIMRASKHSHQYKTIWSR